ncbi:MULTISPECIES: hypothetical protein [unclassified Brevibacterium]|uniref:hypothetical protein n=1 Tax=unclassified Brevibacterium TaxID=2614124 RepID=UPI0008A2DD65|nr:MULTISPECIES: hypothetical protein [unclassified Brevibacterium]OFL64061.1 hypothetical protein HMPREF2757_00960 [Brevibacterium sp. HMSC063G07]
MDTIIRTGHPLSALQLYSLRRDGLLIQLTDTAWIRSGAVLTPALRAAALGAPPVHGTAFSHAAAHWVWWGTAQAPALLDVTTLSRRRVRRAPEGTAVWERSLSREEYRQLGECRLTEPLKTLFDLVVDCVLPIEDLARRRRAARAVLAPTAPQQRRALAALAEDSFRRPGVVEIRRLLRSVDPASHTGL